MDKLAINALLLQIAAQFAIADADSSRHDSWDFSFDLDTQTMKIRLYEQRYVLQMGIAEIWPLGEAANTKDAMRDVIAVHSYCEKMTIQAVKPEHEDCEFLRFHFVRLEKPEITYAFEVTDIKVSASTAPEQVE